MRIRKLLVLVTCWLTLSPLGEGADRVVLKRGDREIEVAGRVLVRAADGGLLVEGRDGVLWAVQPEELVTDNTLDTPYRRLDAKEHVAQLREELPRGFRTHQTAHFLICHYTSRAYARWCGSLLERLHFAFTNFWSRRGFDIREPEGPLVAIVFGDKPSFGDFATGELGDAASSVYGYYSLRTNRVVMYDLTGVERATRTRARLDTAEQINHLLAQPRAAATVATIVHEATHQIAFNCGLQTRYADIPMWVSEGIAMYFETPDLSSKRGWRGIGGINRPRLRRFHDYAARRPHDSLESLIANDKRFRETGLTSDAYAESWALNYFLFARYAEEYHDYMRVLSRKQPARQDDRRVRLADFEQAFGDLEQLDEEFMRFIKGRRSP